METKLQFMQRTLNELDVALTDVTTKAFHVADELALNVDDDAGPSEVIQELRKQIRVGEEYTKPYQPRRAKKVVNEVTQLHKGDCVVGEWHEGPCR